jgi:hypothetical protein
LRERVFERFDLWGESVPFCGRSAINSIALVSDLTGTSASRFSTALR